VGWQFSVKVPNTPAHWHDLDSPVTFRRTFRIEMELQGASGAHRNLPREEAVPEMFSILHGESNGRRAPRHKRRMPHWIQVSRANDERRTESGAQQHEVSGGSTMPHGGGPHC